MRRDKGLLPIIEAWMEGKKIEVKSGNKWVTLAYSPSFNGHPSHYRIKIDPETFCFIIRGDGTRFKQYADNGLMSVEKAEAEIKYLNREYPQLAPYTIKKFVQDLDYQSPA